MPQLSLGTGKASLKLCNSKNSSRYQKQEYLTRWPSTYIYIYVCIYKENRDKLQFLSCLIYFQISWTYRISYCSFFFSCILWCNGKYPVHALKHLKSHVNIIFFNAFKMYLKNKTKTQQNLDLKILAYALNIFSSCL